MINKRLPGISLNFRRGAWYTADSEMGRALTKSLLRGAFLLRKAMTMGGGGMRRRVSARKVMRELEGIAYARADDFVEVKGGDVLAREDAPEDERRAAVQQVKMGTRGVEYKFYNKEWALEKLLGMLERQQGAKTDSGRFETLLQGMRDEVVKPEDS